MEKSTFLIFAALFITSTIISQNVIYDSTIIWGKLRSPESTGDPLSQGCSSFGQLRLLAGDTIPIIGFEKCYPYGSLKAVPKAYYLAMFDTGTIFLPESSVSILGNWGGKISTLSAEEFTQLESNTRNYILNLLEIKNHIQDSLEAIRQKKLGEYAKKCELKGLGVFECVAVDASEYTEGTGVDMTFYNPTKKVVKYVHATVVGMNPVDDPVIEGGKTSHTLKCIGPIEPGESGSYSFEYVWFTDIVERVKLTSIKVQYMDGTEKIIAKPSEIIMPRELIKE
jgi:hypothetical protein